MCITWRSEAERTDFPPSPHRYVSLIGQSETTITLSYMDNTYDRTRSVSVIMDLIY